jgi:hypothetical protein
MGNSSRTFLPVTVWPHGKQNHQPSPSRRQPRQCAAQHRTPHRARESKSSLNAVKTGLTGRTVLLPSEDVRQYQNHVKRFHDELQPVGELETNVVQSLADTQWRLNRIPSLESGLLALGRKRCAPDLFAEEKDPAVRAVLLDAHVFDTEARALKNLSLQESRLRRQYAQLIQELEGLRAERAAQEEEEEEEEEECDCEDCQRKREKQEKKELSALIKQLNGFEFSNHLSTEK